MTFTRALKMKLTALFAVVAVGALAATPAGAIVPPKNCGNVTVGSRTYNIKTDQLSCTSAKKYSLSYLRSSTKPRYYTCQKGAAGSSLKFRCVAARYNPDRTFFAIRR